MCKYSQGCLVQYNIKIKRTAVECQFILQCDNNTQLTTYHLYADISMQIYPKGMRNYKFSINHFIYANKSKILRNSANCTVTNCRLYSDRAQTVLSSEVIINLLRKIQAGWGMTYLQTDRHQRFQVFLLHIQDLSSPRRIKRLNS